MSRHLVSFAALACLASCAAVPNLTAPEQGELAAAMQAPLTFELSKDESEAAWARAQIFAMKHSRIRTTSDFVLDAGRCPQYTAERVPLGGDRFKITVGGDPCQENPKSRADHQQDLHVFAHYVRTGALACARNDVSACVAPRDWDVLFGDPPRVPPRP